MDQRETFKDSEQLFQFITDIFQHGQVASLLIDRNGLTRVEGKISLITPANHVDETIIMIDDNTAVAIGEIIAVNGLFRSDYSEC